jgi:hypothetical protein
MAGLSKDARTSLYVVQFFDPERRPTRRRVPTAVRELRAAERLRRFWEAEYAEGRWDPWAESAPIQGSARPLVRQPRVTLGEPRSAFLDSRAHRAANTRAN